MLYVKSRKSFKVRRQKKFYCFAVCQKHTHGKPWLCRVSQKSTRQSISLPCAKKSTRQTMTLPCALVLPCVFLSTLGKNYVCRVPVNLHTANYGAHGKIEVSGSECKVLLMKRTVWYREDGLTHDEIKWRDLERLHGQADHDHFAVGLQQTHVWGYGHVGRHRVDDAIHGGSRSLPKKKYQHCTVSEKIMILPLPLFCSIWNS